MPCQMTLQNTVLHVVEAGQDRVFLSPRLVTVTMQTALRHLCLPKEEIQNCLQTKMMLQDP